MFPAAEYMFSDGEHTFTNGKHTFHNSEHKKHRDTRLFLTPGRNSRKDFPKDFNGFQYGEEGYMKTIICIKQIQQPATLGSRKAKQMHIAEIHAY